MSISRKVLDALQQVVKKENEFSLKIEVMPGLELTLRLISSREDVAAVQYARSMAITQTEAEVTELYNLDSVVWAIKAINGESFDHFELVKVDDKFEVEGHKYLRDLIMDQWSREIVSNLRTLYSLQVIRWNNNSLSSIKIGGGKTGAEFINELNSELKATMELRKLEEEKEAVTPDKEEAKDLVPLSKSAIYGEDGVLEDPYKSGKLPYPTLEGAADRMSQLQQMEGSGQYPTAGAQYNIGQESPELIPPYHGTEGVGVSIDSGGVEIREMNEVTGGISGSNSLRKSDPNVQPIIRRAGVPVQPANDFKNDRKRNLR